MKLHQTKMNVRRMSVVSRRFILFVTLLGASLSTVGATPPASIVTYGTAIYDNTQSPGWSYGWHSRTISNGYVVTNSFTGCGKVTGIEAVVWMLSGDSVQSVKWAITTAPLGGTTLASGTATSFQSNNTGVGADQVQGYLYVYQEFFTIPTLTLNASGATYWLQLSNGTTAEGNPLYWDSSFGTSTAVQTNESEIESQTFQIIGTPASCTR